MKGSGLLRCVIGGVYYPTIDGSSVSISRSASDPVPTATVHIVDNNSSLTPQCPQEILILDDQIIPNPTTNLALNPSFNPYSSQWSSISGSGLTITQQGGGGMIWTFSNCTLLAGSITIQQLPSGSVTPGQTYMFSVYVQGGSSPTNIGASLFLVWADAGGTAISTLTNTGPIPISTSLTRMTVSGVAPAGASTAILQLGFQRSSTTNSGTITWTQAQFEPQWFPTMSYPSAWCGPAQTNCQQLPLGYWIRQSRKFAGFVTFVTAQNYHGNVRTLVVQASGYAWLMSMIVCNDTFASKTDAQIITTLLGKYLLSNGVAMLSTTNVVTGQTLTSVQSNWDDLRTIFSNLAAQSTFYWTVDAYWNFVYAPPGYFSMQIGLICDNSSQPNMTTTFPAYNFSYDRDFTQPGSNILVLGNGSNVAQVIDPSVIAQLGQTSGYSLPIANSWMRKVNESSLASVADCTQRGMAELLQYDYTRMIAHLTTNVELIPGQSIQITSNTDGLNNATQLIQQTTATWIGTNETLTDEWEYVSDLGATNKAATNILSRIFRIANSNTSAPAISATTLAVLENIGVVDSTGTGVTVTGYAQTILADTPIAYYRLGEITGTIADDYSGNAYQGTINGGVTLNQASLTTHNNGDGSMLFNGSTGDVILPTTFVPTGAHAWSLECWVKVGTTVASNLYAMVGMGDTSVIKQEGQLYVQSNGSNVLNFLFSCNSADISSGTITAGTIYHVVGTYDSTSTRLYVNGTLVAGPTAFALNLVATFAAIAVNQPSANRFFPGTIDEVAIYNFALSAGQVSAHYTAGI